MIQKVSDYIADFLVSSGIEYNFTVTGGGAMHLNDAFGHKEGLTCIYNNHEQACAIAAEAYSRVTSKLACVCVTSGPGGTNAITGVLGGWLDSIPMLIISGQVKQEMTISSCPELGLRQLGDQESDIVNIVNNITKYSVMVKDKNEIAYHLEKAIFLCKNGRGGPVWLDIPLDIQGAYIDTDELVHFEMQEDLFHSSYRFEKEQASEILDKIHKAKAPLILAGSSIQYSKSEDKFLQLVEKLGIPVVTAWAANDSLSNESEYFIGVPGSLGVRAANFAIQQCDLILSLGCRMNVRMVGYNKGEFAKNAYKIMVDIDEAELNKPTYVPDEKICANVKDVITKLVGCDYIRNTEHIKWLKWCQGIKKKYPIVLDSYYRKSEKINPYVFTHFLFEMFNERDTIVCSNGSSCVIPIQVSEFKQGQRLICNSGCASMGYGLPASIGAAFAKKGERIICLEGDGSIMMNIQELASAKYYDLNIKIFLYNNNGYHSIRQTQRNNFGEPLVGVNKDSGVAIPEFKKVAYAFDIPYYSIIKEEDAKDIILKTLNEKGIVFCEVFVDEEQNFAPKSSAKVLENGRIESSSMDDMAPFLDRDEYIDVKKSWEVKI